MIDLGEPKETTTGPTWIPEWNFRHLSLWAIAHRFCAANSISRAEFKMYFRIKGTRMKPLVTPKRYGSPGPDLRVLDGIDQNKLAFAIHDQDHSVVRHCACDYGSSDRFRYGDPHNGDAATFLRYCPICIKQGIHALHCQFIPIRYCPFHGIALQERCPQCCGAIPYTLPLENGPFRCGCGHQFWSNEAGFNFRINERERKGFEESGDRFWNIFNLETTEISGVLNNRRSVGSFFEDENETDLYAPWSYRLDLFDHMINTFPKLRRVPHNVRYSATENVQSTIIEVGKHGRSRTFPNDRILQQAARHVYKAVRRYYYHRLLKKHKSAINALYRTTHFSEYDYSGNGTIAALRVLPSLDPLALAFIAWRCYWELVSWPEYFVSEHDRGEDIFSYRWIDRHSGYVRRYDRYAEGNEYLRDTVELRVLILRLQGVFEETIARIAAILQTQSTDCLNLADIDERYVSTTYTRKLSPCCIQFISFRRKNNWLHSKTFRTWLSSTRSESFIREFRREMQDQAWAPTGLFQWPTTESAGGGQYLSDGFERGNAYFRTK